MIDDKISHKCFTDYINFVHQLTGITIDENRSSMLVGRIRKRVTQLEIDNYESYLELIKNNHEEKLYFTNLITTNETYFY